MYFLEALAMDDTGTCLIILLFGDPKLLEGRQRSQDGSTDPHGVLALWRGNNLHLDLPGCQGADLLLHPIREAGVHGRAARDDRVAEQVLSDVDVAPHD